MHNCTDYRGLSEKVMNNPGTSIDRQADGGWHFTVSGSGLEAECTGRNDLLFSVSVRLSREIVTEAVTDLPSPARKLREAMNDYFSGKVPNFSSVRADFSRVTSFQCRVYDSIAAIPFGETRTYGQLALKVGGVRFSRAVAGALAANPFPLFIPCHRVLPAHRNAGDAGGYSSKIPEEGPEIKRRLLILENPSFR
jgi:O-6-methylguanine DNA methyltransferase